MNAPEPSSMSHTAQTIASAISRRMGCSAWMPSMSSRTLAMAVLMNPSAVGPHRDLAVDEALIALLEQVQHRLRGELRLLSTMVSIWLVMWLFAVRLHQHRAPCRVGP